MNAGKLVAEIAVLAIVAYCCYGAVVDAVPEDVNTLSNPVSGMDSIQPSISSDGLNISVTLSGTLTNNLPQDLVDVGVAIYIGSGSEKMKLASVTRTLPTDTPVNIDQTLTIPVYAIMAYSTCLESNEDNGNITLPLCMKISFKYFEWAGSHLVDMSLTVKTNLPMGGMTAVPTVTGDPSDNSAQVSIDTTSGFLSDIMSGMPPEFENVTLECGDAKIHFEITGDNLIFKVSGNSTQDAEDILEDYLEANGKIDMTFGGETYTLDKEQSEALLEVLDALYDKVGA